MLKWCAVGHGNAQVVKWSRMENSIILSAPVFENSLSLKPKEHIEHIRISNEGFWYKGEKVEQGEGEARRVYDAFCQFLTETGSLSK